MKLGPSDAKEYYYHVQYWRKYSVSKTETDLTKTDRNKKGRVKGEERDYAYSTHLIILSNLPLIVHILVLY